MEEALFLTKFATVVTVIHRRDALRATAIMARRVQEHPRIQIRWNSVVQEILGTGAVTGVRLRDVVTGETADLPVQGVFVAIGHDPRTELFRGQLDMGDNGYLLTGPGTMTSVAGVFGAGDVVDFTYRQAVTAAGMGARAAIDAERWLEAQV